MFVAPTLVDTFVLTSNLPTNGISMAMNCLYRSSGILLIVTLVAIFQGCGSTDTGPKFKVTPVKGKVTMGGQPLADAQVTLIFQGAMPKDCPGSGGKTDAQGAFEILTGVQKGAIAGNYTVIVSKIVGADGKPLSTDASSGMDAGMAAASGATKDLVPATFSDAGTTTQKVTVTDGKAIEDLNITIP